MKLTKVERLILANQFEILEKLYPEDAEYYSTHKKAIENGYTLHYDWLFDERIFDELSELQCKEVLDILEMYSEIHLSYQKLDDKSNIEESKIKFPGFSGNEETQLMGYTKYFINDLDRYKELRDNSPSPYNSHWPMLVKYRKMLEIWKGIKTTKPNLLLSKEDIIKVIEAI